MRPAQIAVALVSFALAAALTFALVGGRPGVRTVSEPIVLGQPTTPARPPVLGQDGVDGPRDDEGAVVALPSPEPAGASPAPSQDPTSAPAPTPTRQPSPAPTRTSRPADDDSPDSEDDGADDGADDPDDDPDDAPTVSDDDGPDDEDDEDDEDDGEVDEDDGEVDD